MQPAAILCHGQGKLLTSNFNCVKFDKVIPKKGSQFFFGFRGGGISESRRYIGLYRMQAQELFYNKKQEKRSQPDWDEEVLQVLPDPYLA